MVLLGICAVAAVVLLVLVLYVIIKDISLSSRQDTALPAVQSSSGDA